MSPQVPPRVDHWPATLISAAVRRGVLVRCGPGYRPVTWPETPHVRCAAIAWAFSPKVTACNLTAAWVWGVLRAPGELIEMSMRSGRVPYVRPPGTATHEYAFRDEDLVRIGNYWVTSRVRTAFDLLRSEREFSGELRTACRLLIARDPDSRAKLTERARTTNPAGGRRVTERLELLYGVGPTP